MPEKLLTIREVAAYLNISEEEAKRLVDTGEIPAYKIGGTFLRFRKEQLDAVKTEVSTIEKETKTSVAKPAIDSRTRPAHPYTDYDYSFAERIRDFFYFNDFYILSFLIILILLYLIFRA